MLEEFAGKMEDEKKDIQGLISRGYDSLNSACYILVQITDAQPAKEYFNILIDKYITSADKSTIKELTPNGDPKKAVQIAFTHTGLINLNLSKDSLATFSREFIEGISHRYPDRDNPGNNIYERSNILGDTRRNHPDNWHWGNKDYPVDCVLMLFAETNPDLDLLIDEVYDTINQGVRFIYKAGTIQYQKDISKEHFGFQDGISQPIMKGFSQSLGETNNQALINPGEFILGHINAYDNFSPSPYVDISESESALLPLLPGFSDKKDLGKNGTYLVFRQIEQHVEKFWNFNYHNSREAGVSNAAKATTLASKMVGRWPDGQPLVTCPEGSESMDENSLHNFSYALQDQQGIRCPLGAHIRRTNPRDQVHTGRNATDSLAMSSKHRILRRGRIYGDPIDEKMDIDKILCKVIKDPDPTANEKPEKVNIREQTKIIRGLHFICMVSDIARQFEFVQNVWANTSTFGDLCNEVDPLISPRPTADQPGCHEFTTPQNMIRNRYQNVPEFTTVVGGAYFFMPGINALKFIMK
jgi:Dyp-type peroxidase family